MDEAWTETVDGIEFRYYGDDLDEVVGSARVHLEQLDDGAWYLNLTPLDGGDAWAHQIDFLTNKGKLRGRILAWRS